MRSPGELVSDAEGRTQGIEDSDSDFSSAEYYDATQPVTPGPCWLYELQKSQREEQRDQAPIKECANRTKKRCEYFKNVSRPSSRCL